MANIDTDPLQVVINKPYNLFHKCSHLRLYLTNDRGVEAVRKLLHENGIQDMSAENKYLGHLKEIESILDEESKNGTLQRFC